MKLNVFSRSNRLTVISLLLSFVVLGCAPAVQTEARPEVFPLSATVGQEQLGYFQEDLKELRITILTINSYQYRGTDEGAFLKIIQGFYKDHPGFCPLVNSFYLKEEPLGIYMTVTAKGHEVAAIVYDQRQKPKFTYTMIHGLSDTVLETTSCS